jgi:peptidoglycan/xylan/chitin deacetylase (PgdA/CDA1 family)
MFFTTSWDDGHPMDLRVAAMLEKYGMTGTFYACKSGQGGGTLSEDEIRQLAKKHEIGAHTLMHPNLPTLSRDAMHVEIGGSKKWLENITGTECTMFAYPYGFHSEDVAGVVRECEFKGARTTKDLTWNTDRFRLSPTIQVHYFPFRPVMNRRFAQPLTAHWKHLRSFGVSIPSMRSWPSMTKAVFRYAVQSGQPWFHLWGHSWCLEKFGLWSDFEDMLQWVSKQPNIESVKNSQLLKL